MRYGVSVGVNVVDRGEDEEAGDRGLWRVYWCRGRMMGHKWLIPTGR